MSVEEARAAIHQCAEDAAVQGHWDGGSHDEDELNAALDRLILEVRAEMPCYSVYFGKHGLHCEQAIQDVAEHWGDTSKMSRCPSCKARAELKVPA